MPAEGQPASGGGCQVRRWQVNDDQSACLRTPVHCAIISRNNCWANHGGYQYVTSKGAVCFCGMTVPGMRIRGLDGSHLMWLGSDRVAGYPL